MAFRIGDSDQQVLSDINVTPLVDVMLVLLIIFMITAPMLHQGIPVTLPEAESENLPTDLEDPLVVSVNREGIVYLQEDPIHPTLLVERLLPMIESRGDDRVYLKADEEVTHGQVIEVLDILRRGGVTTVGMVTRSPEEAADG
ncbi:MAG TPA: biopolymer transporter ExbD [Thermoanaerobaculia bacterium]|nr:biopolymer transporter ExbD [Thermoanaerobaculia bacterium]